MTGKYCERSLPFIFPRKKFEQRIDFKFICAIIIHNGKDALIYSPISLNNLEEEEFTIKVHPRIQEKVSLNIPTDTLASLKKVAASRDMSCEALLKLHIGQGLREDLAKSFESR